MNADDRRAREAYLWDRSGEADAEIVALERTLAPLRAQPNRLALERPRAATVLEGRSHRVPLRAAAALAVLITGVWTSCMLLLPAANVEQLRVTAVSGAPRVADTAFTDQTSLRAGQWLETNATSKAQVDVGDFGSVTVNSDSRVRLIRARSNEQRLELARGSISAFITAPPRLFIVDTPAATAFDLGCAYAMHVDDAGNGVIEVTLGWVSMESPETGSGGASIVPAGAMCETRTGRGAGTPYFADANAAPVRSLQAFDFDQADPTALAAILANARERDSLTLWHLLRRTSGAERGQVFDALAAFAPPPAAVTRSAIMRGDEQALLAWRDTFIWSPNPPVSRVP